MQPPRAVPPPDRPSKFHEQPYPPHGDTDPRTGSRVPDLDMAPDGTTPNSHRSSDRNIRRGSRNIPRILPREPVLRRRGSHCRRFLRNRWCGLRQRVISANSCRAVMRELSSTAFVEPAISDKSPSIVLLTGRSLTSIHTHRKGHHVASNPHDAADTDSAGDGSGRSALRHRRRSPPRQMSRTARTRIRSWTFTCLATGRDHFLC